MATVILFTSGGQNDKENEKIIPEYANARLLKEHLVNRTPISDLCNQSPLNPIKFHCLHSAIGCITPTNKLQGRKGKLFAEKKRILKQALERR
jgi:hypothetical protein